jgi:hypothetical protein
MKKMIAILMLAVVMAGSTMAMADDASAKPRANTIFNALSDFFATFNRPFTRPDNKQNFCNATADWIKNINK